MIIREWYLIRDTLFAVVLESVRCPVRRFGRIPSSCSLAGRTVLFRADFPAKFRRSTRNGVATVIEPYSRFSGGSRDRPSDRVSATNSPTCRAHRILSWIVFLPYGVERSGGMALVVRDDWAIGSGLQSRKLSVPFVRCDERCGRPCNGRQRMTSPLETEHGRSQRQLSPSEPFGTIGIGRDASVSGRFEFRTRGACGCECGCERERDCENGGESRE